MPALIDHLDLRVGKLPAARRLFDPLMEAMGQTDVAADDECVCYYRPDHTEPFLCLEAEPAHLPNEHRVAFGATSPGDVDRLAAVLRTHGARAIEGPELCAEYSGHYYAVFFEDDEGNKYEICSRR